MNLTFEDVRYSYRRRDRPVLDGLRLSIPAGRTILLGPNGAGKSTLLAIAASVLPLGEGRGRVAVDGVTPDRRGSRVRFRRRVAWMPQTVTPAAGVTVRQQVALHGWLAGMPRTAAWTEARRALVQVGLEQLADARSTRLSGGQRARMGLAQALVHAADVLLLDEPTAALDPDQKEAFVSLLARVSGDKVVVVSSHDVSDLEASYDRVVVLEEGQVRFEGPTAAFLRNGAETRRPVDAYRAVLRRS
ncbi:MAG: ATP-binding cassette domain-containing protein [Nocardioidaceae bacterium]|nr:ATP-binding cassette domain-containing protein [Nocardioidaceae bacterium]